MAWLGIYNMEKRKLLALSLQNVVPKNTATKKKRKKQVQGIGMKSTDINFTRSYLSENSCIYTGFPQLKLCIFLIFLISKGSVMQVYEIINSFRSALLERTFENTVLGM